MIEPIRLSDRALVLVTGEEAEKFLQAIITTDLSELNERELKPGALLTPQGKILFDFLVSRIEGGLRFDLPASQAADFAKRLTLYRLRSKAEISLQNEAYISTSWKNDSAASYNDSIIYDRRFPDELEVVRHYESPSPLPSPRQDGERGASTLPPLSSTPAPGKNEGAPTSMSPSPRLRGEGKGEGHSTTWTALRIAHGVAESGHDYALGDAFPHDVNLDQTGGVSFRKGCFIGQEVVSRMQHRGTARRRVLVATGEAALPAPRTPLTVGGREIGTLGSVAGDKGLALVRIDRVKEAMDAGTPILAGEVTVTLAIPPRATFGFPETQETA
ncbi:aminomethyltransferase [Brucella endophytica]|uniref:Aminomethyltransferase n=1 Tax=Brucella endophytica TaxID=1963359 RepID=A0A916SCD9_9HYPH|nr:folate-binding protein YgfZ [Brucella endophytica]GGA93029.1 aminomethyltransferase [Brucella endophytica]